MLSTSKLAMIALLALVCATSSNAQDDFFFQRPPEADELKGIVDDILKGNHAKGARSAIGPDALLVDGTSDQFLLDALFGATKSRTFELEHQRMVVMHRLWISPDFKSAFVIAKTVSSARTQPRLHSVFFTKAANADWLIRSWHTSN
jgi:hypothetical protein